MRRLVNDYINDDARLHHASTGATIYGQQRHPVSVSVSAQSNFRFRCYSTPNL
jgi:hypothetical protein